MYIKVIYNIQNKKSEPYNSRIKSYFFNFFNSYFSYRARSLKTKVILNYFTKV